jgi:hypothetical protein
MTKWLLIIGVLTALTACEKTIELDLNETSPKLVVEATIENGQPPIVVLTKSVGYFSNISPDILANSFVHNAIIKVSNGTKTHQLKEYQVPLIGNYSLYYYSIDSSNLATAFEGQINGSYTLQIISEGQQYDATTTIPSITKSIDTMWWRPTPFDTSGKEVDVLIRERDKPGFGDFIRYFTKKNDEPYLPGFQSVYDDLVIDGTTYEVEVEPGFDRNKGWDDEDRLFRRGDTVTLKLSNIDKATYEFWRTMEYSYSSIGNPFASPVKVISNISNGALGYFGGYASQFRTIIIPE